MASFIINAESSSANATSGNSNNTINYLTKINDSLHLGIKDTLSEYSVV